MLKGSGIRAAGVMRSAQMLRAAAIETDGTGIVGLAPGRSAHAGNDAQADHARILADFDVDLIGLDGEDGQCSDVDGQILADVLGRSVVSDMRVSDLEMGGNGGTISPVFLRALAAFLRVDPPVCFVDFAAAAPGAAFLCHIGPGGVLTAFDAGPGLWGVAPSEQAADQATIAAFLDHSFCLRVPPKRLPADMGLPKASDATRRACVVGAVLCALDHLAPEPGRVIVSGAGEHSPVVQQMLGLVCEVSALSSLAPDLDDADLPAWAVAFAAVQVALGYPISFPGTTGVAAEVGGGQISRPARQVQSPHG